MNNTRRLYATPHNESAGSRVVFAWSEDNNCTVIPNVNGSLAFDWENIPETIILDGIIGGLLFGLFVWLTSVAWRRADSNDTLKTQNLVTFLYGYRDPERWYVIPRLEFLRREDRHHQHDMAYPYIYVPPKLPLANPLEMFAYGPDNQAVKSIDSAAQPAGGSVAVSAAPHSNNSNNHTAIVRHQPPLSGPPPLGSGGGGGFKSVAKSPHAAGGSGSSSSAAPRSVSPGSRAAASTLKQLQMKSTSSTLSDGPLTSPRLGSSPGRSGSSMGDGNDSSDTTTRRDTLRSGAPDNSFFFPSILTAEQMQASWLSKKLNRFFGMFFRVTDADIIYSRGIDAYEYLLFQRHLIFIMFITTVLCMGVILPIHWIAGSMSSELGNVAIPTSFQRSTIKNIQRNSQLHWAHIACSGLIVVATLKVMGSYMQSIMSQEEAQISRRTLLIGNIPSEQRNRVELGKIFREYFPRDSVEAIQFVYDTGALVDWEMYLSATIRAKEYCQAYKRKRHSEIFVHHTDVNTGRVCDGYCRCCSFCYICCCFWPCEGREPGAEYYAREEKRFRAKIAEACERLVREPTEYAFVTFRSHKHARRVMSELANLKQEVLAGASSTHRPVARAGADGPAEQVESLDALRSSDLPPAALTPPPSPSPGALPLTTTKTPATATEEQAHSHKTAATKKPASGEQDKRPSSQFIEAANYVAEDPLDPKNNPHVRSIRSPLRVPADVDDPATAAAARKQDDNHHHHHHHPHQQHAHQHQNQHPHEHELGQHKPEASKSSGGGSHRSLEVVGASSQTGAKPQKQSVPAAALARLSFFGTRAPTRKLEGPVMWSVRYAPHPDNVEFGDLLNLARTSKYTIILLHVLMIIIFIFVTTPNVILSIIERLAVLRPEKAHKLTGFQGLMINYFSILLQIIATALLPALITLISKQIPYEDSSTKGHSVMWKVYAFLILMVIVMPSIGMTSAQALFETDINPKCLFPTDNGAYYINYVISSTFLTTILELIKPADILFYYFILWTSRSTAEVEGGRQFIEREFSVGMQHTQVLLIFSVVMTYSISCPLIAPVGLLYLCVKHAVDHYNLYYTYFTKKVDKDLQSTIVIFVKVALLLMLFQTTVAIYINTGTSYLSLLTQMIFWVTLAGLVFNCFFDCTSRTPASSSTKRARYHNEFCACFYLPKVISNLLRSEAIPHDCVSRKV